MAKGKVALTPKSRKIYEDNVYEDQELVDEISEVAAEIIFNKFGMDFTVQPKFITVLFILIWDTLVKEVSKKRETHDSYGLNVCGRFEIGFKDRTDSDDEKQGNFVPFVNHVGTGVVSEFDGGSGTPPQQRFVQFNADNILAEPDTMKKIAATALKRINDEADIEIVSDEAIIPILVITYDSIVSVIKAKRQELNEWNYEVNFANCFTMIVTQQDENDTVGKIGIRPSIDHKTTTKSDAIHFDLE